MCYVYIKIYIWNLKARWPSGLRRQFKALVFGRGFESRFRHNLLLLVKTNNVKTNNVFL